MSDIWGDIPIGPGGRHIAFPTESDSEKVTHFLALDCETSGLTDKHAILSFAAVTEKYEWFYADLCWDELLVSIEAMKVNQIDLRNRIGDSPSVALRRFNEWLEIQFGVFSSIMAVGFNVGSFDLKMFRALWEQQVRLNNCRPEGNTSVWDGAPPVPMHIGDYRFHYRHIELNSCLQLLGIEKEKHKDAIWELVREKYKTLNIQRPMMEHDALSDAMFNMITWHELRRCVKSLTDLQQSLSEIKL